VELITVRVRDAATLREVREPLYVGGEEIKFASGTNYVEARGTLTIELPWRVTSLLRVFPQLVFAFEVRFLDDKGNALTQTLEVPEALPRVVCSPGVPGCPAG
jgi:hypothetical protein